MDDAENLYIIKCSYFYDGRQNICLETKEPLSEKEAKEKLEYLRSDFHCNPDGNDYWIEDYIPPRPMKNRIQLKELIAAYKAVKNQ